ncbi:MAG: 16S rRNA (guanine(527)-N(7))-methyltransferase RsmG [Eggerthellaceae bacterium]|jgi:16S rRNA (guanine527-N7)-methyltransferase|nr:16S rRNA (guanine(527)-N(7))-methyltransferase RsmG [Eggerthellaceae bacterium]
MKQIYKSLDEQQKQLIERHLDLIIDVNKHLNLTRIQTRESGQILHIEDSLSALPEMKKAPQGLWVDLGSGAGYPAIPLSIALHRNVLLVDSVKKKMAAMDSVIKQLNLSNMVTTYDGRVEELARVHSSEFSVVTARAITNLASLLELASPLLALHGQLIAFKGSQSSEEIEQAKTSVDKTGMELVSQRDFVLSDGISTRSILVYEKTSEPRITLPRRNGMAQKRPFC